MQKKVKAILITVLVAIPAFILGPMLWPPSPMSPLPTVWQLPFFIFLSAVEALLFGGGIAFLILAWPKIKKGHKHAKIMYFALAWLLISWWPHDNLHMHVGMDLQ